MKATSQKHYMWYRGDSWDQNNWTQCYIASTTDICHNYNVILRYFLKNEDKMVNFFTVLIYAK